MALSIVEILDEYEGIEWDELAEYFAERFIQEPIGAYFEGDPKTAVKQARQQLRRLHRWLLPVTSHEGKRFC